MSYDILFIDPTDHSTCPDEHHLPDAVATVLNHALKSVGQAPLSEWHPKAQGKHAEGVLAKALAHLLAEPNDCLWATKQTSSEDYEDAVFGAVQLWRACRHYPDHGLSINF